MPAVGATLVVARLGRDQGHVKPSTAAAGNKGDHKGRPYTDLVQASFAGRETPGKRLLRYWTKPERSATRS
jgi:hypothetical protein